MPDRTLGETIKLRMKGLECVKQDYEDRDQLIARYVNPRRELLKDSQKFDNKGERRGKSAYTGEPSSALGTWVDGMQGHMVSQSLRWFKGTLDDFKLNRINEIQAYLQEYDEAMYGEFSRSNFYAILSEWFRDAGSIGTATLYTEEDMKRDVSVMTPIHPREMFIAEDMYGVVDTNFRKFFLTARSAYDKFGKTERLNQTIIDNAERHPDKRHEFIHAVFPNTDRMFGSLLSENKPIASVYVQVDGNQTIPDGDVLTKSGYDVNPYTVWRLRKNSDEIYGYSPAADAMVDILKLNQMSKLLLTGAHKAVAPPMNIPERMRGNVHLGSDGKNYFEKGGDQMSQVSQQMNFPIAIDREEKIQRIIEDKYRVEFFLILSRAEREMTATEIMERQAEKAVLLGPQVDRLEQEGLSRVFDIVSDIADKAGRLPEPPQILIDLIEQAKEEGRRPAEIKIQFTGPLAQAQRRLFHMQPIKNGLNELANASVLYPAVLDTVHPDRLADSILDSTDFPQGVRRTDDELAEFRKDQERDLQEQKLQEQAIAMADSYPKLTGTPEEGSPAEAIGAVA